MAHETIALYFADYFNRRIRKVDQAAGIITTIAGGGAASPGDGGPATSASIAQVVAVAVDSAGNLYIAGALNGRIRAIRGPIP